MSQNDPRETASTSGTPAGVAVANVPGELGVGDHVGCYRLLSRLGEGGFGVVYVAEQEWPIRRRVALKVIKPGMDTREVIARFEAERQALAMMGHPGVAAVYDAGATAQGRPYFVMEFVQGEALTDYCDKNRLSVRVRLGLFVEVCGALQHAHSRGIIHRDLKPANILVTELDGKPVPKVIDFGVAKATNQRLTEKTIFTEQGRIIGTPEYMSPEQAEMTGLDVDGRTDVYSLGVVLYELLTGTLPLDKRELRAGGYEAIQRMIREVEPPKPSTRLSKLTENPDAQPTGEAPGPVGAARGPALATIARDRSVEPGVLRKLLRGDLDWIAMKALEKERVRRYGDPRELAEDIHRFLRGDPVASATVTLRRALRRALVRHHRALLWGAVAAVLVVSTVQVLLGRGEPISPVQVLIGLLVVGGAAIALTVRWAVRQVAQLRQEHDAAQARRVRQLLARVGVAAAAGLLLLVGVSLVWLSRWYADRDAGAQAAGAERGYLVTEFKLGFAIDDPGVPDLGLLNFDHVSVRLSRNAGGTRIPPEGGEATPLWPSSLEGVGGADFSAGALGVVCEAYAAAIERLGPWSASVGVDARDIDPATGKDLRAEKKALRLVARVPASQARTPVAGAIPGTMAPEYCTRDIQIEREGSLQSWTVTVDIIGIRSAEDLEFWRGCDVNKYFAADSTVRAGVRSRYTVDFKANGSKQPQLLTTAGAKWRGQEEPAALVMLASIPGGGDQEGGWDQRRLIIPLKDVPWDGRITVLANEPGLTVLTRQKAAGDPRPCAVEVALDPSLEGRTVEVDIVGVNNDVTLGRLRDCEVGRWFGTGSKARLGMNPRMKTIQFTAESPEAKILTDSDPIWKTWDTPGELVVLASIPGLSAKKGEDDPRRRIVPLGSGNWPDRRVSVLVTPTGLTVTAPEK